MGVNEDVREDGEDGEDGEDQGITVNGVISFVMI